jgi:D-glycero-alpha-D-manno-heptose-7-phosphate kinase
MILIRTPVRISFLGGGTDQSYYYKTGYGCVLGQSIDKYLYVLINKRFDKKIRVGYSKTEIVKRVSEIKHDYKRISRIF